jgi:hypothetical protein
MRNWKHLLLVSAAVAALGAAAVAGTAVWDHTHPGDDSHRLWVADWECEHLNRECDQPKPWHEGWHRREPVYHLAFAATSGTALVSMAGWLLLARRRRRTEQEPLIQETRDADDSD